MMSRGIIGGGVTKSIRQSFYFSDEGRLLIVFWRLKYDSTSCVVVALLVNELAQTLVLDTSVGCSTQP